MRGVKTIRNNDVVKVKRFMIYFYRLFYMEGDKLHKALFLPHILGVFVGVFGRPKSIKKYELHIIKSI